MSVIVAAMPKETLVASCENLKRKCEDTEYISRIGQSVPKKRRVQFSESSMCKVVLSVTDLSSIDNDSDISSESSQSSSQDELSPVPSGQPRATAFSDLALKNGDLYEQCVPTKLEDGPSRVTQTTNGLILLLVEHGTITSQQVSGKLQSVADSSRRLHAGSDHDSESPCSHEKEAWSPLPPSDSPPASPPTPGSPSSLPLSPRSPTPTTDREVEAANVSERAGPARRGCDDYSLCEGVYARLRALSDRIHANGRAPLLPSTAVMGREFLPALRFLRSAVRDAAANGMRNVAGPSPPPPPS